MRAIVIPMVGDPEVLALCEMPEPHPGRQQVRIRVAYASVNYIESTAHTGKLLLQIQP